MGGGVKYWPQRWIVTWNATSITLPPRLQVYYLQLRCCNYCLVTPDSAVQGASVIYVICIPYLIYIFHFSNKRVVL